jgi:myo-inositol-1(or 4)-monophosphatase
MLKKVVNLVQTVGEFMKRERTHFDNSSIVSKDHNNLVSYVDKEAEKRLIDGLQKILPEAGFITEENTLPDGKKALNWVIDPLDGTTNYLHGLDTYAINIALSAHEDVHLAISYFPKTKNIYTALKGEGAFKNGEKIHCSTNESFQKSLVMLGFPYKMGEQENDYIQILKKINASSHGFRQSGCAAYDMALVAEGAADAYIEYNVFPWDIVPGILLVKESGGFVSDFKGGNNFWDGNQIVAAGKCYPQMIKLFELW